MADRDEPAGRQKSLFTEPSAHINVAASTSQPSHWDRRA